MTVLEENYENVSALALQAARAVRKRYPTVELDDLISVGLMWAVQHPRKLAEYLRDEDEKRGTRMLVASLKNEVRGYARKQRAYNYGYALEDDAFYSKRMLKGDGTNPGLLHYVFDRANWASPPRRDDAPKTKGDPAEGGTWLAMMVDLDKALQSLTVADRQLLREHYGQGTTYDDIGEQWTQPPVSKTTVAKYIDRAVKGVQDFLGGPRPREDAPEPEWEEEEFREYVGSRRAISNAHARAITENQSGSPQHLPTR
jgi:RNA polymerase sigma factor (sigma-70 family)